MKHKFKDLQFLLEYIFFCGFVCVLKLLSVDRATHFCGFIATRFAPLTSLHRRAFLNLRAAFPDWSDDQLKRVVEKMWYHTGRTIAETILMHSIFKDSDRFEIRNSELIEAALKVSGPIIFVTFHLGNWEIFGFVCQRFQRNLAGVYRPIRNPYINKFLFAQRLPLYKAGLFFKKRKLQTSFILNSAAIAVMKVLRNGDVLGLVCDQSDTDMNFTVPFFGLNAKFTSAPAILAGYFNAPIWIARCYRSSDNAKFIIEAEELSVQPAKDRDEQIYNVTLSMAKKFEEWIRETPEQWMWWQRRKIAE